MFDVSPLQFSPEMHVHADCLLSPLPRYVFSCANLHKTSTPNHCRELALIKFRLTPPKTGRHCHSRIRDHHSPNHYSTLQPAVEPTSAKPIPLNQDQAPALTETIIPHQTTFHRLASRRNRHPSQLQPHPRCKDCKKLRVPLLMQPQNSKASIDSATVTTASDQEQPIAPPCKP